MLRLRGKLLFAYLLPALAVLLTFAWIAYRTMRQTLEAELGRRLVSIAQAAAAQVDGMLVDGLARAFAEEGDLEARQSRTYAYLRNRLATLQKSTSVRTIALVDKGLRNLVEPSGTVPVGEPSYAREADRTELLKTFGGEAQASVLYRGKDGVFYKSGYAPVYLGKDVIAAVAVDGSAEFFEVLGDLRGSLLIGGGVLVAVVVVVSAVLSSRLTRPLRSLVEAAQAIGRGELGATIQVRARDEVGFLARTMEEMRRSIEARDREMQMMLAGIAHEVRNPLGGIELYAGLLREELGGDPRKLARIQRIERELAYLKNVVNDFLDYARKSPIEKRPLDLREYLGDVVMLVASEAEAKRVRLEVHVDDGATRVVADDEKLRRALLNLLRNSLQATPEGGTIAVRTASEGALTCLSVCDTGEGIPEERQREVFTPFFTTRERGTGLGLAFVKRIVEAHGGEVRLESKPGMGTTVSLLFPTAGGES